MWSTDLSDAQCLIFPYNQKCPYLHLHSSFQIWVLHGQSIDNYSFHKQGHACSQHHHHSDRHQLGRDSAQNSNCRYTQLHQHTQCRPENGVVHRFHAGSSYIPIKHIYVHYLMLSKYLYLFFQFV